MQHSHLNRPCRNNDLPPSRGGVASASTRSWSKRHTGGSNWNRSVGPIYLRDLRIRSVNEGRGTCTLMKFELTMCCVSINQFVR